MSCCYYCDCENCYPNEKYQKDKLERQLWRYQNAPEFSHRSDNRFYTGKGEGEYLE